MRKGYVDRLASGPREETSLKWRSRTLDRAGHVRMACGKVSGCIPHGG